MFASLCAAAVLLLMIRYKFFRKQKIEREDTTPIPLRHINSRAVKTPPSTKE